MSVRDPAIGRSRGAASRNQRADARGGNSLTGGGPDGNEVLTTATGIILLVLLAALGVTIVFIGRLLSEHLFLGLLLLGPIVLKMASTGYRFTRYYTGEGKYVEKGPPWWLLRMTAPFVVLTTLAVFITGLILLGVGPLHRDPWSLLHKVSFILWLVVMAVHVAGHIPELSRLLGVRAEIMQLPGIRTDLDHAHDTGAAREADGARVANGPGSAGRLLLLGGSLVVGLIVALALVPDFHTWTTLQPLLHHHDH